MQRQVDIEEAERLAQKVVKGKGFDMVDLKGQLEQLQQMGGVGALMDKLPPRRPRRAAWRPSRATGRCAARSPSSTP